MTTLTFLGTGTSQGVPVISCDCYTCASPDARDKRLRSSVLIERDGVRLLIDCGPDFRQQMLREGVRKLDGILFTHDHKDHIAGIDDVRAFNYTTGKAVDIYAEKYVQESIRREFSYALTEPKYPGVPEIDLHTIDANPFEVEGMRVVPVRGMHYRLPVLGFRLGNLCYMTDMNRIEADELKKLEGLDVLVINALRKEKHLSHFCLAEALDIIDRVKPREAWLTHVSHQMGRHAEIYTELPEGVHFAYDGLKLRIEDER